MEEEGRGDKKKEKKDNIDQSKAKSRKAIHLGCTSSPYVHPTVRRRAGAAQSISVNGPMAL